MSVLCSLQALIYPTLQAVDLKLPSYIQNEGAVIGTAEETALVLLSYMGVNMSYASIVSNTKSYMQRKNELSVME